MSESHWCGWGHMPSLRVVLSIVENGSQSNPGVLSPNVGHRMLDRNHPALIFPSFMSAQNTVCVAGSTFCECLVDAGRQFCMVFPVSEQTHCPPLDWTIFSRMFLQGIALDDRESSSLWSKG